MAITMVGKQVFEAGSLLPYLALKSYLDDQGYTSAEVWADRVDSVLASKVTLTYLPSEMASLG